MSSSAVVGAGPSRGDSAMEGKPEEYEANDGEEPQAIVAEQASEVKESSGSTGLLLARDELSRTISSESDTSSAKLSRNPSAGSLLKLRPSNEGANVNVKQVVDLDPASLSEELPPELVMPPIPESEEESVHPKQGNTTQRPAGPMPVRQQVLTPTASSNATPPSSSQTPTPSRSNSKKAKKSWLDRLRHLV